MKNRRNLRELINAYASAREKLGWLHKEVSLVETEDPKPTPDERKAVKAVDKQSEIATAVLDEIVELLGY